ncbi:protein CANDIDATE G-PROTEIN COUPLED RECEPTOR 2-like isoform X2 [Rhododendron vialii]|uniref:protein CANDIDATE G-PROTEIN COUPLED RECEPTOR 2-like isoform X2 n=1 Tax=Rhododendron vialii TaxID=182163 RepID=UPI0026600839|nr:protein CANDIDATE G-PROTEIN COUPLED RECEPTOR 2-like isoform X2 [Rhododendron vialii]
MTTTQQQQQGLEITRSLSPTSISHSKIDLSLSSSECHGFWRDAALAVPAALFVLYLAFHAKKNLRKLSNGRNYVTIAYYALLWLAALLNLAWCSLQENHSTGFETLARAFTLSGFIVGVDILLKAIFVFGFRVPLFVDSEETTHRMKWGLWTVSKILLAAVYGFILFVHSSKWQDKLPSRPMFYNYVVTMFLTNAVALFACALAGIGLTFGLWLYNLMLFCYHCLYLPFLYITFSADIFQEEDLRLDNAYYSEMKDAGFFDVDWD